jgi:uncharacterized protein (DUF433 family)
MELIDTLVAHPAPIKKDAHGVLRIGGTRVTLDTVVGAFNNGSSADEILLKYPSLNLTDVYAVITYYLWHRTEVDAYLQQRNELARSVRGEVEALFPPQGVRERLLARRNAKA